MPNKSHGQGTATRRTGCGALAAALSALPVTALAKPTDGVPPGCNRDGGGPGGGNENDPCLPTTTVPVTVPTTTTTIAATTTTTVAATTTTTVADHDHDRAGSDHDHDRAGSDHDHDRAGSDHHHDCSGCDDHNHYNGGYHHDRRRRSALEAVRSRYAWCSGDAACSRGTPRGRHARDELLAGGRGDDHCEVG